MTAALICYFKSRRLHGDYRRRAHQFRVCSVGLIPDPVQRVHEVLRVTVPLKNGRESAGRSHPSLFGDVHRPAAETGTEKESISHPSHSPSRGAWATPCESLVR